MSAAVSCSHAAVAATARASSATRRTPQSAARLPARKQLCGARVASGAPCARVARGSVTTHAGITPVKFSFGGDLIIPNRGKFVEDLEEHKALGVFSPPDGGYEGRFILAVKNSGYYILNVNARGLGDVEAYLTKVHGVRPAHVGKQPVQRFFEPGLATTALEKKGAGTDKGVCIWIQDGLVLSKTELAYLTSLATSDSNFKVVVECGFERETVWKPLGQVAGKVAGAF